MKKFFGKAFDQGFIAVCAAFCTSPLLLLLFFPGTDWVLWVWIAMVVIVFLLGGVVDWFGDSNDEEPYYIHD